MSSEKAVQEAPRRGALIIFEGLDRCGKTTQCKQLVAALQQEQVSLLLYLVAPADTDRVHLGHDAPSCCLFQGGQYILLQVQVEHLSFPDRKRPTGVLIDKFLRKEIELDPVAVHLLFSTNRQECRCSHPSWLPITLAWPAACRWQSCSPFKAAVDSV